MQKIVQDDSGQIYQAFETTGDIDFQIVAAGLTTREVTIDDHALWQAVRENPGIYKVMTNDQGSITIMSKEE